jgi:hypothetical protein
VLFGGGRRPAAPRPTAKKPATWSAKRRRRAEAKAKAKPVRTGPKVGRNDPCPCGSGKKYKQCCGKRFKLSLALLAGLAIAMLIKQFEAEGQSASSPVPQAVQPTNGIP